MSDEPHVYNKAAYDAALADFHAAVREAKYRKRGWFEFGQDHEVSLRNMQEALRGGCLATFKQLPKDIQEKVTDQIDSWEINFMTVEDVKQVFEACVRVQLELAEGVRQAVHGWEVKTFGPNPPSCSVCGVKASANCYVGQLFPDLIIFDPKYYCVQHARAADEAATAAQKQMQEEHAQEQRRRLNKSHEEL